MEEQTREKFNEAFGQDKVDQLNSLLMEGYFKAINHVYIDLETCFDYKLGALLSLISSQEEYDHIMENLENYEHGVDLKIARYFPKLKFTEEQIMERLTDPEYNRMFSIGSPQTSTFNEIGVTISALNTINAHKDDTTNVTYYFGNTLLPSIHPDAKIFIKEFIAKIDATAKVVFIDRGIGDCTPEFIKKMNYFIIYNIINFLKKDTVTSIVTNEGHLVGTPVIAYPMSNYEDELEQRLSAQEYLLNHMFDFTYLIKRVVRA